jgi:fatty-acid peroxygenase
MQIPSPHDRGLDSTLALLREGYMFGVNRFERLGCDLFAARLMGEEAVWIRGPEAVGMFYDDRHFTRVGAIPRRLRRTLIGDGGVQTLDGAAHRARKAMLLSLVTPIRAAELVELAEHAWLAALARWTRSDSVDLFTEAQAILCRAACDWAGVPLASAEVVRRAEQFGALFDALGGVGPRHWRGRLARRSLEGWLSGQVEAVRRGDARPAEGRALAVIAGYRDVDGAPLAARTAAVELISVLGPIVAIARYVVFAAHALHLHPRCRQRLGDGGSCYARQFVQELRRYYPLAPFVGARVREDLTTWTGHRLRAGTLVLLDIHATHRDPRCWPHADQFVPERFEHSGAAPFGFIPQGGGEPATGHRCAGEGATIELVKLAAQLLAGAMEYEVTQRDLDLERIPPLVRGRFLIRRVRSTVNFDVVAATSAAPVTQDIEQTTGVGP